MGETLKTLSYKNTMTIKEVQRREENDDHLTTEERRQFLTENNVEFTEENLDEVFVDFIF